MTAASPGAIDRAAEPEASVVLTPEAAGPATRLAPIVSRMNNTAASKIITNFFRYRGTAGAAAA